MLKNSRLLNSNYFKKSKAFFKTTITPILSFATIIVNLPKHTINQTAMTDIVNKISSAFAAMGTGENQTASQRFFKESITCYGVKAAQVTQIAKNHWPGIKHLTKSEILNLCSQLWQTGYMENGFVACNWSYRLRNNYEPNDFVIFEQWIDQYISNWATCDTLCNHTIGTFLMMYPNYLNELTRWTQSDNRWKKRAAAVSLIVPARKGLFLNHIFKLADQLLHDPDDLVQKGYGWMLKSASQAHEQAVFEYVMAHRATMPRTALRYAIEKMPQKLKSEAMKR
jgi:3-methyladenine DNA glycosylase AlkD